MIKPKIKWHSNFQWCCVGPGQYPDLCAGGDRWEHELAGPLESSRTVSWGPPSLLCQRRKQPDAVTEVSQLLPPCGGGTVTSVTTDEQGGQTASELTARATRSRGRLRAGSRTASAVHSLNVFWVAVPSTSWLQGEQDPLLSHVSGLQRNECLEF